MSDGLIIVLSVVGYYVIGPILYGLMHRYDPKIFTTDASTMALVILAWIVLIPLYWFGVYCDRCISWFEKKK